MNSRITAVTDTISKKSSSNLFYIILQITHNWHSWRLVWFVASYERCQGKLLRDVRNNKNSFDVSVANATRLREIISAIWRQRGNNTGYRHNPPATKPPRVTKPLVQSKFPSFYTVNAVIEKDINSSRCILCTLRRTKGHDVRTTNTSSCVYAAIFHSQPVYDAQSTVYDIFLCRHT